MIIQQLTVRYRRQHETRLNVKCAWAERLRRPSFSTTTNFMHQQPRLTEEQHANSTRRGAVMEATVRKNWIIRQFIYISASADVPIRKCAAEPQYLSLSLSRPDHHLTLPDSPNISESRPITPIRTRSCSRGLNRSCICFGRLQPR